MPEEVLDGDMGRFLRRIREEGRKFIERWEKERRRLLQIGEQLGKIFPAYYHYEVVGIHKKTNETKATSFRIPIDKAEVVIDQLMANLNNFFNETVKRLDRGKYESENWTIFVTVR